MVGPYRVSNTDPVISYARTHIMDGRVLALFLMLTSGSGRSLPERAASGEAAGRRSQCAGAGGSAVQPSATWGSIEQKCDHFTRASWTPEKKHMRHDMMREEGRRGRTAEGHANAYTCRLQQRYCMISQSWERPIGPVLLVVGGEYEIDQNVDGFVLEAAAKMGEVNRLEVYPVHSRSTSNFRDDPAG